MLVEAPVITRQSTVMRFKSSQPPAQFVFLLAFLQWTFPKEKRNRINEIDLLRKSSDRRPARGAKSGRLLAPPFGNHPDRLLYLFTNLLMLLFQARILRRRGLDNGKRFLILRQSIVAGPVHSR
jgi:hypothetical protein